MRSQTQLDEISDGLKHVRLKSHNSLLFIIIYHLFGEYTLSQWGLSSDLKLPLMLLVGAQIINSACGPVGIIMAKYGQFMRLIGYAFLSLIFFATCLFISSFREYFYTVSIGVLIMQFLENILKLTWWNNYKKVDMNSLNLGFLMYDSRSGSTWLASLLHGYSSIVVLKESTFIAAYYPFDSGISKEQYLHLRSLLVSDMQIWKLDSI